MWKLVGLIFVLRLTLTSTQDQPQIDLNYLADLFEGAKHKMLEELLPKDNILINTLLPLLRLNDFSQITSILNSVLEISKLSSDEFGLLNTIMPLLPSSVLDSLLSAFNLGSNGTELIKSLSNSNFFEGGLSGISQYASMSKIVDLIVDYGILIPTNLTERCVYESKFFLKSLLSTEYGGPLNFWTIQMMDAQSKMPSGITQGNINWLGDFDQCLELEAYKTEDKTGRPDFKGEYCLAFVLLESGDMPQPAVMPKVGVCLPAGCTGYDKMLILNYWLFLMPFRLAIQERYCHTSDGVPWDNYGIFAVLLIGALVSIGVVGTLYDYFLYLDEQNNYRFQLRRKVGNLYSDILLSFSYYKNSCKIFNLNEEGNSISSIHGLKVLSMIWITIVHIAVMTFQDYPWRNQLTAIKMAKSNPWLLQLIADASLTTEIFFTISGLLVTYVTLNSIKKLNIKFNVGQFYLFRYWRLTPPYFVILCILSGLIIHLGSGPTWALIGNDMIKCQDKWWRNVLYIQNLFPDFYDQCFLPSWYLAVDTQMFMLAPLFIIPLIRKPKMGMLLIVVTIAITTITPAILTYVYDLETYTGIFSRKENMDMFADMLYNKPWNRISTYLIGMLVGYVMHAKGKNIKMKSATVAMCHVIATVTVGLILFGPVEYFQGKQMPAFLYALYGGFVRPAFGACVAWCVYSCYIGYGGILNSILSHKILIPLSRLSYSFYLSHMLLVHHYYYSRQDSLRIEYLGMITMSLGIIVISFFLAYLLSVVVESPFIELLHVIVKSKTGMTTKSKIKSDDDKKSYLRNNTLPCLENGINTDLVDQASRDNDVHYLPQGNVIYRKRQSPID